MEIVLLSFLSLSALYVLYLSSLLEQKEESLKFLILLLISFLVKSVYYLWSFYGTNFEHSAILPLGLISLALLYFSLLTATTKKPVKRTTIFFNLLPFIVGFILYLQINFRPPLIPSLKKETFIHFLYLTGGALSIIYSSIIFIKNKGFLKKKKKEAQKHIFLLNSILAITGIMLLLFSTEIFYPPNISSLIYIEIALKISMTLIIFLYIFQLYETQLKENFVRLSTKDTLLSDIIKEVDTKAKKKPQRKPSNIPHKKAVKTIQTLFEKEKELFLDPDFNLTQLSEITHIPNHKLSHIFKTNMKVSFTQYINKKRIEHACKLLDNKENDLTVAELSTSCGYKSRTSFYNHFKKEKGMSYGEYKAQT